MLAHPSYPLLPALIRRDPAVLLGPGAPANLPELMRVVIPREQTRHAQMEGVAREQLLQMESADQGL